MKPVLPVAFSVLLCAAMPPLAQPPPSGSDPEALAAFNSFLDSLGELQQSFVQDSYGTAGELLERVRGRMALRHPGNFRWEILQPWEQYIVVNKDDFWSYDPDLQQAVKRSSQEVLQHTPAAILLRFAPPEEYFTVFFAIPTTDDDKVVELSLLPYDTGAAAFEEMTLSYSEASLNRIAYTDHFGRVTEIVFSDLAEPFADARAMFDFKPPPGVDVIADE